MALNTIDYINGPLFTIFSILSLLVGIHILLRYFKVKKTSFIYVGLAWIFLTSPWFPSMIAFFNSLLTGASPGLHQTIYFFLGNIFVPLAAICWIAALAELLFERYKKILLPIFIVYGIVFYIVFFLQLAFDQSAIGTLVGDIDVKYESISFVGFFYISILLLFLITGILFTKQTISSPNKEIRIKSRFLLLAFFLFTSGALLDALIRKDILTIILMRALEISGSLCFYFGFILPKSVEKVFVK